MGSTSVFAQQNRNIQTESQLAFKYFRDKEYRPASTLFFNLHKATRSKTYLNYYIESLLQLESFQDAEKAIKKEMKKNKDDKSLYVVLGYIYKKAGEPQESNIQYDKAIESIIPVKSDVNSIANAFISKREYDYAIQAYEKGRILMKQEHIFHSEMANIFLYQRDFEKMVTEYLLALSIDQNQIRLVENRLQSALLQDINSSLDPILRNKLLQKIQTEPDKLIFKELLLWYFMQKKQFKPALTQAKSIDLIAKEDGFRLLSLAIAARSNNDFETAIKCFQIVIDKGEESSNYLNAQMGDLETRYLLLENKNSDSFTEWKELEERYQKFFIKEDKIIIASPSLIRYAHISAFHLNNPEKGIELLEKALNSRGINQQNKSKIKVELADIKLLAGENWDAILLYSQVEKSNKNNPIGYEAKFKKAKVSYYMGELKWAKAQLDAIKGSTSKLIANDAIALSQSISDNTTLDTSYTAMKLFAAADYFIFKKKDSLALSKFDELLKNHPGHSLTDEMYLKKYEIYKKKNQLDLALASLAKIIEEHPYEILADKALLFQAELFEKTQRKDSAIKNYKTILTDYPDSIYSVEAREKLKNLQK